MAVREAKVGPTFFWPLGRSTNFRTGAFISVKERGILLYLEILKQVSFWIISVLRCVILLSWWFYVLRPIQVSWHLLITFTRMSESNNTETITKRVGKWYFGGTASAGAACVTHPLDLLKVMILLFFTCLAFD